MNTILLASCWLVTGISSAFAASYFESSVGVAWESNINRASSVDKKGASSLSLNADIGREKKISDIDMAYISIGYDGLAYPRYNDLSFHGVALKTGYEKKVMDKSSVIIGPNASQRFYGDNARDGLYLNLPLSFEFAITSKVNSYIGYSRNLRRTDDPIFDTDTDQWSTGIQLRHHQHINLNLGYGFLYGREYFYSSAQTTANNNTPAGKKSLRRLSTFGVTQDIYSERAKSHIVTTSLSYDLFQHSFLQLGYSYMTSESSSGRYNNSTFELNLFYFQ